jgi:hypothetical protein
MPRQVVGWPSAQPYALAGALTLGSLLLYTSASLQSLRGKAGQAKGKGPWRPPLRLLSASLVLYALALVAKAAALTALPAFILLVDAMACLRGGRDPLEWAVEKLPFVAVMGMMLGVSMWANQQGTDRDADIIALDLRQRAVKAQVRAEGQEHDLIFRLIDPSLPPAPAAHALELRAALRVALPPAPALRAPLPHGLLGLALGFPRLAPRLCPDRGGRPGGPVPPGRSVGGVRVCGGLRPVRGRDAARHGPDGGRPLRLPALHGPRRGGRSGAARARRA